MYLQLDQVAETSKYGVLERNFQSWVFKALNSFQEGLRWRWLMQRWRCYCWRTCCRGSSASSTSMWSLTETLPRQSPATRKPTKLHRF
ncbi:unnamed protein product [Urochloa humidicola]